MRELLLALTALCAASAARGQEEPAVGPGDSYFGATAGYSWYSPAATHWGLITGRRVYLASIRAERVVAIAGPMAMTASIDVPLAVVERTKPESSDCWPHPDPNFMSCRNDFSSRLAVGTGPMPGLRLLANRAASVRVFTAGAAGLMLFNTEVPVREAGHLNFALEYGAGIELSRGGGRIVTLGYKFYHVSNGSMREYNPGLDANVLYLTLLKRR